MWYIYQGIITAVLSILAINLILNLRSLHRLSKDDGEPPETLPLISILIPARNEERNITACVESLLTQDYPSFEILVLDDDSSDNTAAIIESLAAADSRVRLLRGKPLPDGWAGKPFACAQLAATARGDWLLFTDADTVHTPNMLSSTLAYSHSHKLSLLSGFPMQRTVSFSQRIVIPVIYSLLLSLLPLWWLQGLKKPRPGFAFGQFLFFKADDYRAMGGHEVVKSRIVEDLWLGLETVRRGKRQGVVDLSQVVTCRMYTGLVELYHGLNKIFYSMTSLSPLLFTLVIIVGAGLFLTPFALVAGHFIPILPDWGWSTVIAMQVALILLMQLLIDLHFQQSRRYFILHPAGISFLVLCCFRGVISRLTGAGVEWKERHYSHDSTVK
jgi:chlorobactene glucosyltransferase